MHLTEIAGKVNLGGFRSDPRLKDMTDQEIHSYHNMVQFTSVKVN